ncbi:MAG: 4a-hydroxytetrahydrobiopterin dehydratase [Methylotenera sp.]|nr:4a-hydroxytetrahydrobiopterin dehydratase [Methylotenera sp.]MSP99259.1 4a-hydroxytetrahydrobiopterin dehydratase [Methylotenera sp.]
MDKMNLTAKKCTPCQGGIPPMSCDVAEKYLHEAPEWELLDNATKLKRTFKLDNFEDAMQLAQRVGELCETEGHHPDLIIGWGYCRVEFQTHKINGLHENDFIMAAKVNQLVEPNSQKKSRPKE